ncbi:MAG: HepT-like ribonuclease domain-containing protein [Pseudonocardiaceae bacterium]
MRPEDTVRLRHLTEAATKAIGCSTDRTRADLDSDELLRLALTKLVEIVGEAAKQVSGLQWSSEPSYSAAS